MFLVAASYMYSSKVMQFRCKNCGKLFGRGISSTKSRNYPTEKDWKQGFDSLNLVDEKIDIFCSNKCLSSYYVEHSSDD